MKTFEQFCAEHPNVPDYKTIPEFKKIDEVDYRNIQADAISEKTIQLNKSLDFLFPMANSYVHEHPIGNNEKLLQEAKRLAGRGK